MCDLGTRTVAGNEIGRGGSSSLISTFTECYSVSLPFFGIFEESTRSLLFSGLHAFAKRDSTYVFTCAAGQF